MAGGVLCKHFAGLLARQETFLLILVIWHLRMPSWHSTSAFAQQGAVVGCGEVDAGALVVVGHKEAWFFYYF